MCKMWDRICKGMVRIVSYYVNLCCVQTEVTVRTGCRLTAFLYTAITSNH